MKIIILYSKNYSPNEIHFLSPLYQHAKFLSEHGDFSLEFKQDLKGRNADIIIISSKFFSQDWTLKGCHFVIDQLKKMRQYADKLVWCDISDSTGTTHFRVLPYVDRYLKNQILKDKSAYLKKHYGARIYSDFIYRTFYVNDLTEDEPHLNYIPEKKHLDKVRCGWNSGLAYFGRYRYQQNKVFQYSPSVARLFKIKWVSPFSKKNTACSCRIGTSYGRNTIRASRELVKETLKDLLPLDKLSHKSYQQELKNSISAVSPFGLGEISLRDFEVIINGSAMIKQDMSHLETWPNLWISNETYLPFQWDFSDLKNQVEFAMTHSSYMQNLAAHAQTLYKRVLNSKESPELFLRRFFSCIFE